jgi:magnesium transporter
MNTPKSRKAEGRESLLEVGPRIVAASAALPHEAGGLRRAPGLARRRGPTPGTEPGAIVVSPDAPQPVLHVMAYGSDRLEESDVARPAELREWIERPGTTVWIDVEGLGDESVLSEIGAVLGIHPLAMADVVHVPQRPKAELHDDRLLIVAQMARMTEESEVDIEQVSLVLGPGWVVSFQERAGDVFNPVRERLRSASMRIRRSGADFLAYALLDAVIDGYFPVIEALAGVIDALEEEVVEQASRASLARIHATRRTLLTLHRVQWRQRDAIGGMLRDESLPISDPVRPYLRDTHDHAFQTLDALETYREMMVGLMDLCISSTTSRTNEVMKTLTIVATIFIPLTFVTGVYGMNFQHMPELAIPWAYPLTWLVMLGIAGTMLIYFWRKKWL